MRVNFTLNGAPVMADVRANQTLLDLLRSEAVFSVKHGCETGECGACAVLVGGELRPSCLMPAARADGCAVDTAERLGTPSRLNPIHQAFLDCGGVQCGYCTPAMVLATEQLLGRNPAPTEQEARECLSGVLCRCTGYVKPVEAILRAAALLRGEEVPPVDRAPSGVLTPDGSAPAPGRPLTSPGREAAPAALLERTLTDDPLKVVGRPQPKLDGPRLVTGRPAFTADVEVRGLLHARLLLSPHAHARIKRIDATAARALPGVHAVLTHQDVPRVSYTSAGQSWPEPSPHDMRSLDDKVRFVGDRVAAVAAETPEIAARAIQLIDVEYEILPAITDMEQAIAPGAPVIHDEPDSLGFGHFDFARNIAAQITATHGDVEQGFAEADLVIERTYRVPKVQQTSIEPHVTLTYLDEDDRLVVRTSTQVPFHVRRIIAPLIGLPISRIRVIKPRIGGGFGGKQEVLIEDICAHLTLATGRPVKLEYTRAEEFTAARSRHPQIITIKTGVKRDGTLVANEMRVIADTGAYGSHALTVQSNTGVKTLPLYRAPHLRFECTTVYTNLPPAGAFRGYGVPQGAFALECQMDEVARLLGMDPWEFRAKNWVRVGDVNPLSKKMNEGKEGYAQEIHSCGLAECVAKAGAAVGYGRPKPSAHPHKRRGVGGAIAMQGSAIPGVDMGGAMIKIKDRIGGYDQGSRTPTTRSWTGRGGGSGSGLSRTVQEFQPWFDWQSVRGHGGIRNKEKGGQRGVLLRLAAFRAGLRRRSGALFLQVHQEPERDPCS